MRHKSWDPGIEVTEKVEVCEFAQLKHFVLCVC